MLLTLVVMAAMYARTTEKFPVPNPVCHADEKIVAGKKIRRVYQETANEKHPF